LNENENGWEEVVVERKRKRKKECEGEKCGRDKGMQSCEVQRQKGKVEDVSPRGLQSSAAFCHATRTEYEEPHWSKSL
jgi:hypothetical protein